MVFNYITERGVLIINFRCRIEYIEFRGKVVLFLIFWVILGKFRSFFSFRDYLGLLFGLNKMCM